MKVKKKLICLALCLAMMTSAVFAWADTATPTDLQPAFAATASVRVTPAERIAEGEELTLQVDVEGTDGPYDVLWEARDRAAAEEDEELEWKRLAAGNPAAVVASESLNALEARVTVAFQNGESLTRMVKLPTVEVTAEVTAEAAEDEVQEAEQAAAETTAEPEAEPAEEPVEETAEPEAETVEEPAEEITEPETETVEEPTEGTEPSAEDITEPEAETVEEPAEGTEPAEEITEPEAETVEEPAEETEPAEEITEPETETVEEPAEETEPAEDITEPEAETVEEPAEETEPAEEITEPEAETVEEPAEETEPADDGIEEIDDYEAPLGLTQFIPTTVVGEATLREDADGLSAVLATLNDGEEITVVAEDDEWIKAVYGETVGYIWRDSVAACRAQQPAPQRVRIFTSRETVVRKGEQITLTSLLEGFEDTTVAYQWECDTGDGFHQVEGATEASYTFTASSESLTWSWRLIVYSE